MGRRRRGSRGKHEVWRRQRCEEQRNRCALCGGMMLTSRQVSPDHPRRATLDHIIPRSRGGPDKLRNVQAAHKVCNEIKGCSV